MSTLPYLPTPLYNIIEEYQEGNLPKGSFSLLNSQVLPQLPSELLQIIISFAAPTTHEDLVVLYLLDPNQKSFKYVFKTTDQTRIQELQTVVSLPERTTEEKINKFTSALYSGWYPLIRRLYLEIGPAELLFSLNARVIGEALARKDDELIKSYLDYANTVDRTLFVTNILNSIRDIDYIRSLILVNYFAKIKEYIKSIEIQAPGVLTDSLKLSLLFDALKKNNLVLTDKMSRLLFPQWSTEYSVAKATKWAQQEEISV